MNKSVRILLMAVSTFSMYPVGVASSQSLAAGSVSGAAGTTVTMPITFTAGSTQVAAFQFSMGLPSGWSISAVSAGPTATGAAKMTDDNPSNSMVIVFGDGQQAISTGVAADVQISIPSSASSGSYSVSLSGVILSDPNGAQVTGSSTNGSVTVQSGVSTNPVITSFTASPGSISAGSSSTLSWNVTGATSVSISPGVGTVAGTSVPVSPTSTTTYTLTASNGSGSATATATVTVNTVTPTGLQFVPTVPCRVADTRKSTGAFGGPEMSANSTRNFNIPSSACGIPGNAVAYSLNVTVVPNAQLDYLTMWPTGQPQPYVSTLNSDGRTKANAAIVPAGSSGGVSIYVTDATQVILDIDGYFVPAGTASALKFYALTPCRVADTRQGTGSLAGPYLSGGATGRSFPILSSSCSVPSGAQAYSLNFTAVPHGYLSYITVWPSGQPQPLASTLNATTGTNTANAALVSAGSNGNISVYASNDTDLVIDINGYFGSAGAGGLSLYTVTPCRVLDTRNSQGSFNGTLAVNVAGSGCGVPSTAQVAVLNATVVPSGALQYLTLGPYGQSASTFSTLNALDGAITSNMAIVPMTSGLIDAFSTNPTQLILDVSSYFAP